MAQQASVENVVPLVPIEVVEKEQVEAGEDVGEHLKEILIKLRWIWRELL
jgi:hypothetical protein